MHVYVLPYFKWDLKANVSETEGKKFYQRPCAQKQLVEKERKKKGKEATAPLEIKRMARYITLLVSDTRNLTKQNVGSIFCLE